MSIRSLEVPAAIRRRPQLAPRDYARRDQAIELFESRRFLDAVHESLHYLLRGVQIPDLATQPLCFVQGSARIRVRVDAGELSVSSMLATLAENAQTTAALRYFLTRLSATGQLYQPRLRDGSVSLEFREQLDLVHPLKLIEVLQRLPMEADRNDQWLATAFGVETPDREAIAALDADEFDRAQALWNAHWGAVDELLMESRRRRSRRFLDAVGAYAAYLPRYALPLFGSLRQRLQEHADNFTDSDEPPNKRDAALAKCIKEMRQIDAAALRDGLGHANYAINPLHEGGPAVLSSMFGGGPRMQNVGELRACGHSMDAALLLIADYLDLLAYQSWPIEVEQALRAGLDLASGKPWREAADGLWTHANSMVREFGSHGERERDDNDEARSYDA